MTESSDALTTRGAGLHRFEFERVLQRSQVRGSALVVLLDLATHWDKRTGHVRVGIETLAQETRVSEKTVRRALAMARDTGLVDLVTCGHYVGDRSRTTNVYRLGPGNRPPAPQPVIDGSTGHADHEALPVTHDPSTGHLGRLYRSPDDRLSDGTDRSDKSRCEGGNSNLSPAREPAMAAVSAAAPHGIGSDGWPCSGALCSCGALIERMRECASWTTCGRCDAHQATAALLAAAVEDRW